jgi:hypothetical protein
MKTQNRSSNRHASVGDRADFCENSHIPCYRLFTEEAKSFLLRDADVVSITDEELGQCFVSVRGSFKSVIKTISDKENQVLVEKGYLENYDLLEVSKASLGILHQFKAILNKEKSKEEKDRCKTLAHEFYEKRSNEQSSIYLIFKTWDCNTFLKFLSVFVRGDTVWKNLAALNNFISQIFADLEHDYASTAMLFRIMPKNRISAECNRAFFLHEVLSHFTMMQRGCFLRAVTRIRYNLSYFGYADFCSSLYDAKEKLSRSELIQRVEKLAYGSKWKRETVDKALIYDPKKDRSDTTDKDCLIKNGVIWHLLPKGYTPSPLTEADYRLLRYLLLKQENASLIQSVQFFFHCQRLDGLLDFSRLNRSCKGVLGLLADRLQSEKSVSLELINQTIEQIIKTLSDDSIRFLINQAVVSLQQVIMWSQHDYQKMKTILWNFDVFFHKNEAFFKACRCATAESIMMTLFNVNAAQTLDDRIFKLDPIAIFEPIIKNFEDDSIRFLVHQKVVSLEQLLKLNQDDYAALKAVPSQIIDDDFHLQGNEASFEARRCKIFESIILDLYSLHKGKTLKYLLSLSKSDLRERLVSALRELESEHWFNHLPEDKESLQQMLFDRWRNGLPEEFEYDSRQETCSEERLPSHRSSR